MKKLLTILCVLLLLFTISGCHGSKTSKDVRFDVPEDFDVSKDYNITFWAKNDSNKSQVEVYRRAISEFEGIYPNVHITLKLYTDYTRIYNDVITNISTNTTPNVCITYPDHIATYLTGNNTIVDLGTFMDDDNYGLGGSKLNFDAPEKDEIVPKFLDECIIDGKYYALPYMRSTEALYINEDYVKKLGYEIPDVVTWDFVWEVSELALAKDENGNYKLNGQKTMIPFIYKSTDNMLISILKQSDLGYSNDNGEILLFNDDTKAILNTIKEHTESGAFSTFKISSYPGNFLNAGQCVFAIDSTAGATWMGADAPLMDIAPENVVRFNTVVRPIPQVDVDNPQMISQGPSICVFNKEDNQEVLASWLFAQYLLTNSIQCGYAKTEGYVPVTSKALNCDEYVDYMSKAGIDNNEHYNIKIEASKLLIDNVDNTFVTPVFNGSASLRNAAGQLIEETCKAINRNKTVDDEFFNTLYSDINSLYHLDQTGSISSGKDLGPLPKQSKILLGGLVTVWAGIATYFVYCKVKKE